MKPMKILYLITRSEVGGAQTHLVDLLGGFKPHFEQVVVAGGSDGEQSWLPAALRELDIPFRTSRHLIQPINPRSDCKALIEIIRVVRAEKPDLIHAHTSKAGVLGRLAARVTGVPAVFTAHTWSFAEGTSLKWRALGLPGERVAARWTKRIITVSDANRRMALERRVGSAEKLVTVHNGIRDDENRADPASGSPVTLVMVARFSSQKDHATLLSALAGIHSPYRLLLVGDGPTMPAMQAEAARLGLQDRVVFLGARTEVSAILSQCHALLLTTNWEGFPITILEAMRAGLPVIATDTGGIAEAVVHEKTGLLVGPRNVDAVRNAVVRLLESAELRARLGSAGRTRYEEEFGLSTMLRRTLGVYEAVLRTEANRNPGLEFHAGALAGMIRAAAGNSRD
jgi:glycosyltransferase involved in cell wall biosynthesis